MRLYTCVCECVCLCECLLYRQNNTSKYSKPGQFMIFWSIELMWCDFVLKFVISLSLLSLHVWTI